MRKDLLVLLAVLIPGAFIALAFAKNSPAKISSSFAIPTPYPTVSMTPASDQDLITTTPAASRNIEVLSPRAGDIIHSPFGVKGNARVFENVVSIRLIDAQGKVLLETTTQANSPDVGQFGPFEKMLKYSTDDTQGTLEIYALSPKDGTEIDKVSISLIFK